MSTDRTKPPQHSTPDKRRRGLPAAAYPNHPRQARALIGMALAALLNQLRRQLRQRLKLGRGDRYAAPHSQTHHKEPSDHGR